MVWLLSKGNHGQVHNIRDINNNSRSNGEQDTPPQLQVEGMDKVQMRLQGGIHVAIMEMVQQVVMEVGLEGSIGGNRHRNGVHIQWKGVVN